MKRSRGNKIIWKMFVLSTVILLGSITGCNLFFEEFNPNPAVMIDFFDGAAVASFGESSRSEPENTITIDRENRTVNLYARNETNNAGKIANAHDGITFFFRQVPAHKNFRLSASVKVISFGGVGVAGETTSNGQEGFGLMVRDFVPFYTIDTTMYSMDYLVNQAETGGSDYFIADGSLPGRSNMLMAGAMKRGIRYAWRKGITGTMDAVTTLSVETATNGDNSEFIYKPDELADYSQWPTLEERPDFPKIGGIYNFTLEKTNSGFSVSVTPPAGTGAGWKDFIWEPDNMTVVNPDFYYVGFFAARMAEIEVFNIHYAESEQSQDAPRENPLPEVLTPQLSILSPATSSDGKYYRLIAMANVPGYLSVKQNGIFVPGAEFVKDTWLQEHNMAQPAYFDIPVFDLIEGENVFQIYFYPENEYPEDGIVVGNTATIKRIFLVNRKSYFTAATPVYVAPGGRSCNAGTYSSPLDIDTAVDFVLPGQTIVMKDGSYDLLSLVIPRFNSGRYGFPKKLVAEHRDKVFIDFKKDMRASGVVLAGDFWVLSGIHIRNTPDKVKGLEINGNNNVIEWVKTYDNGDTGLQISGRSTLPKFMWPKHNTISYCESYSNLDAAQEDADGFGAKLTVGDGNRFEWCIAHHNVDDGWDLYSKVETGKIGVVVIENCISYRNGFRMDGMPTRSGRNGFKLGGEGLDIQHVVRNSLAFQNGANGVTGNSNPDIILDRVTSFDNGWRRDPATPNDYRNFTIYTGTGADSDTAGLTGLLSLYPAGNDINRRDDQLNLTLPAQGYVWQAGVCQNKNNNVLTPNDMDNCLPPLWNADYSRKITEEEGFIRRKIDGTYDLENFLKPLDSSLNVGASF